MEFVVWSDESGKLYFAKAIPDQPGAQKVFIESYWAAHKSGITGIQTCYETQTENELSYV